MPPSIKEPPTPLADIPYAALEQCARVLAKKIPQAVVTKPADAADQLELVFAAGRRSVVDLMLTELQLRGEKKL